MTASLPESNLSSRIRFACASVVFLSSLALYAATLAPTVTLVDSGELIVAAKSLGVAHPPGFPFYLLLAHLATAFPFGNIAQRVNFASALFAAAAAAVITLAVIEALIASQSHSLPKQEQDRKPKKRGRLREASGATFISQRWVVVVASVGSGLVFAISRTLWAYATIAEVYTLNTLLIVTVFFLLLRWRNDRGRDKTPDDTLIFVAAFFFGLGLGVHHVTVALTLPAIALFVLMTDGLRLFKSRGLIYATLSALAGLSVYAYLPIAASRSPVMNWGDPRTLERFWWHVSGRQYQVFLEWSLSTMIRQFGAFTRLVADQLGPWWFPAAIILTIAGLVASYRRDRALFWFLIIVIAADLVYCLGYEIAEDKDAYYLPVMISAIIAAGLGISWLEWRLRNIQFSRVVSGRVLTTAVSVLIVIVGLLGNIAFTNRRGYFIARDYLDNIYSSIEPGGMLLTRDWQVYSPSLYQREIEDRRTDVVAIDINQLRRSWYFSYLERSYPNTIDQAREKVDAFLEDLVHWEHDPEIYQRDAALNQRISARFYDMIMAFVSNHLRSRPVYVTLDVAANRDGQDSELTKSLSSSYQLFPQGLIFQVTPQREFQQPVERALVTRGLSDGSFQFEDGDVVKLKILPVYVTMFYNQGRYFAANGRFEQAVEAYKKALELQPGFAPARQAIIESTNAQFKTSHN